MLKVLKTEYHKNQYNIELDTDNQMHVLFICHLLKHVVN